MEKRHTSIERYVPVRESIKLEEVKKKLLSGEFKFSPKTGTFSTHIEKEIKNKWLIKAEMTIYPSKRYGYTYIISLTYNVGVYDQYRLFDFCHSYPINMTPDELVTVDHPDWNGRPDELFLHRILVALTTDEEEKK